MRLFVSIRDHTPYFMFVNINKRYKEFVVLIYCINKWREILK